MSKAFSNVLVRFFIGIAFITSLFSYWPGNASSQIKVPSPQDEKLTIIFDLGGVLFQTSAIRAFWYLGPQAVFNYWRYKNLDGREIKRLFYKMLNAVSGTTGNKANTCDPDGDQLPYLMVAWLTGEKSCYEIKQTIYAALKAHPKWFANSAERTLMRNMTSMIFTPEKFINTLTLVTEMASLVKRFKANGHRLYILSNFDPESFQLLVEKHSDLFALFDGMVISGYVGDLKPNASVFSYFLNKFDPDRCIFIDDQKENILAAEQLGIHTIQCRKISSRWSNKVNVALVNAKLLRLEHTLNQAASGSCA